MILISCADNALGLSFNGRRQSRDRAVSQRILSRWGEELWLARKSEVLFEGGELHWIDDPSQTPEGQACFWEEPTEALPEKIILYRWNRDYPSDRQFSFPGGEERWVLTQSTDFPGFSHECVTEEVYERKER